MKRLISIFTAFFLILPLAGCFGGRYTGGRRGPAMWVVEDADGGRCYLFGSIHVGRDGSMFPFADVIEDAFSYCDGIAVEYDVVAEEKRQSEMSMLEQMTYLRQFMYTDGTTIKDHISADTYEKMAAEVSRLQGVPAGTFDMYCPALWYSLVSEGSTKEAGYDSQYGVDRYFINRAYETGKTVYEIESESEQLEMMLGIDDMIYEDMIKGELDPSSGSALDYMYTVYSEGDMARMEVLTSQDVSALSSADAAYREASERFVKAMYTDRNKKMADAVMSYLSEGKRVFVVVGCAHMLGENGIVSLLQKNGLKVYRK